MSIHLIIIGAGLAGLSAGISTKVANPNHQVTILESVKELAEIGVSSPPSKSKTFSPKAASELIKLRPVSN
jgi:salicylate hydroxylase